MLSSAKLGKRSIKLAFPSVLVVFALGEPSHAGIGKLVAGVFEEFAGLLRNAPADDALRATSREQLLLDTTASTQRLPDLDWTPRVDLHGPRYRYSHQIPDEDDLSETSFRVLLENAPTKEYNWLKFYLASRAVSVGAKEIEQQLDEQGTVSVSIASLPPNLTEENAVEDLSRSEIEEYLASVDKSQEPQRKYDTNVIGYVSEKISSNKQINEALNIAREFANSGTPFDHVSEEIGRLDSLDSSVVGRILLSDVHLESCGDRRISGSIYWPQLDLVGEVIWERSGSVVTKSEMSSTAGIQSRTTILLRYKEPGKREISFTDVRGHEDTVQVQDFVLDAFDEEDLTKELINGNGETASFSAVGSEKAIPYEKVDLNVLERNDGLALVERATYSPDDATVSATLTVYDIVSGIPLLSTRYEDDLKVWLDTVALEVTPSLCSD